MNIRQQEWMGKRVAVVKAANASLIGMAGIVVDETKEFIMIEMKQGIKKVLKAGTVFDIDGEEVDGSSVQVAPQERLNLKVV